MFIGFWNLIRVHTVITKLALIVSLFLLMNDSLLYDSLFALFPCLFFWLFLWYFGFLFICFFVCLFVLFTLCFLLPPNVLPTYMCVHLKLNICFYTISECFVYNVLLLFFITKHLNFFRLKFSPSSLILILVVFLHFLCRLIEVRMTH